MNNNTFTDVNKAAAVAVIKKFDDLVDELAARHKITKSAALLRVSSSPDHAAAWRDYRQAQQIAGPPPAPAPVTVSPAFQKMERKAEKRALKNGTSVATEFSKIYQQRPDLAAEDKEFHFAKAAGRSPVDAA